MNTYRIYEDLRSSLGEEAARSLAHTLGPMFEELGKTVTKAEFQELNATLGRLAEAQERPGSGSGLRSWSRKRQPSSPKASPA